MLTIEVEKRLTTILAWGALVVTLLVTDRVSMDPVNVGKMLGLAVAAGSSLVILINSRRSSILAFRSVILMIVGFLCIALGSIFFSRNSWEKGFFGTYGRNTGFLTYLSLSILFIAATQLYRSESYLRVIRVLMVAGVFNLCYCLFAINGVDIFTWGNPYGRVLGTFGNPNFISSFMGIFFAALSSFFFSKKLKNVYKFGIFLCGFGAIYVVIESGSQQGGVVAVGGFAIVLFFFLRSRVKNRWFDFSYLIGMALIGLVSIAGMLQKGPLAGVLYKQSVSLRGEYWQAGINMGVAHPFFGIGLDSFGTFYRTYRNESATIVPGINTISDAAHNIFIDVFASTGVLGILFYGAIIVLVMLEVVKYIRASVNFDPVFVLLFSTWVVYQAQSIISINQIGLVIWGWVLGGLLFGYTRKINLGLAKVDEFDFSRFLRSKKPVVSPQVPARIALGNFLGGIVFLLLAAPSFYADAKLRQAVFSNSAEKLFSAAQQFPLDSNRINYVAAKISQDGINEQTVALIRIGLEKFPNSYDLLFSQFQIYATGSPEKREIGKRLHLADPFNPAFDEYK
jgi:O-antigen ligase